MDSLLNRNAYFNTIILTIAMVNISLSTNKASGKRFSTCHPGYQNLKTAALVINFYRYVILDLIGRKGA